MHRCPCCRDRNGQSAPTCQAADTRTPCPGSGTPAARRSHLASTSHDQIQRWRLHRRAYCWRDFCRALRSEEHTSELQSLMRNSYAVFCLKKKKTNKHKTHTPSTYTNTNIIETNKHTDQ